MSTVSGGTVSRTQCPGVDHLQCYKIKHDTVKKKKKN